ncbi:C40 family peptidase [Hymenobacter elongatus]|uniref:C40 family peptidase n=1 Tax=Hymenobacter elongatus TaxID=877208 RepID=UPI0014367F07|nr:C40 family peptidase [Hymenobacter elongatus]
MAAVLVGLIGWQRLRPSASTPLATAPAAAPTALVAKRSAAEVAQPTTALWATVKPVPRADSIVRFAMQQIGAEYCYAGTTPTGGFDCSGFLTFVYSHFGIQVPHSTALLHTTGKPIPREQARKGDMVIFTGTATTSATPGHAGIVISDPGQPIRFIHSSSARKESGVKISSVEKTDYERRFMGIRRVL